MYTPAFQARVAAAMERVEAYDPEAHEVIGVLLRDYLALRDKVRAQRAAFGAAP